MPPRGPWFVGGVDDDTAQANVCAHDEDWFELYIDGAILGLREQYDTDEDFMVCQSRPTIRKATGEQEWVAEESVRYADALIAELDKP